MTRPQPVTRARAAFARQTWREAFRLLTDGGPGVPLDPVDYERLAVSAYLVGEDAACTEAWQAAHLSALEVGDMASSARSAMWLALCLMLRGETGKAGGWLARAERLVDEAPSESATEGYLLVPRALGALGSGDPRTARDLAVRAAELGERFGDPDLRALGVLGDGQARIASGDRSGGLARLDEVMVSVTTGEVGPLASGIVYCAVILECIQLFDLRRAAEWTEALSAWCDAQPDLVPFRGQCLVHRSQLQQARGDWRAAAATADAACRTLTDPPHPAAGLAYYQRAELHRLTGALDDAETAYRLAGRHGHSRMPGLALLQLSRGDATTAAAGISGALREAGDRSRRPALLSAAVDVFRAAGDLTAARSAADELVSIAADARSDLLTAMAVHATGAVLTGAGEPAAALAELRGAATAWRSLGMPYEAARTAVLLGLASAALGDRASAALDFDDARLAFTELGAVPDLEQLADVSLLSGPPRAPSAALSRREREVLLLVVAGRTNREIAERLVISQHTVSRHLEHIFAKLGVRSRAAATAYAYEHDLL